MPLTAGDTLGPYEITGLLGKGGMGEVYRASDTRLRREVAIKVSDEQFGDRFQREARAVAALNHPNICTLYDVGENYLVMELVEGPTLADRIQEGPIPLEEALAIARQIADALEAAHEKGITHRDLKPANVNIRPDGMVKVLDFGLAKIAEPAPQVGSRPENSPTLTLEAATRLGVVMGTAGYMPPEQAKGKEVDKRADIWAFGVVLYEMVTGKRLFHGEDLTEILASVVKEQPDFSAAPSKVRRLLSRCLEKDPKKRLRDIGDAWELLEEAPAAIVSAPSRSRFGWVAWALAAGCLAIALGVSFIHFRETAPEQPVLTVSINPPDKASFLETAISPDGKLLAFTATSENKRQLWVRPLHSLAAQPLTGTEQAVDPFWSPDSRWIGFFAQGKLKKIEASGGPAQTLCDAAVGQGGAWNQDGVIVYAGRATGLFRVAAQGGSPAQLTAPDRAKGEGPHRWPVFLPGGRSYVYLVTGNENTTGIYLGALDSKDRAKLVGDRSSPGYAEGPGGEGYLLFVRESTLMAQRFDAGKGALAGEAFPVAEKVVVDSVRGRAGFSVSGNGMLVHESGGVGQARLTWMDRGGKRLETVGDPGDTFQPALSPDGRQVAFAMPAAQGQGTDIWVLDLARGIPTRFTFHPSDHFAPVWSPDGSRIVFISRREGPFNLYLKSASGAGQEERLLKSGHLQVATDWTAVGNLLLYYEEDPKTKFDLWVLPMTGERKPAVFLRSEFNERHGAFSPDGKWIAYQSDESGRTEIHVQPYPATGAKWQVSRDGGRRPRWRGDGREMYWLEEDGTLMAAEVSVGPSVGRTLQPGNAAALFETGITNPMERFAVTADGKRFLVPAPVEETEGARPVTVVWNWLTGARR